MLASVYKRSFRSRVSFNCHSNPKHCKAIHLNKHLIVDYEIYSGLMDGLVARLFRLQSFLEVDSLSNIVGLVLLRDNIALAIVRS